MVIVHFDRQECPQIYSEKRASHRIRKRRKPTVNISTIDRVLRHAQTVDTKDLPDVTYAHLYRNTKHFLSASLNRVKSLGRYLRPSGVYCEHCAEFRQLLETQSLPLFRHTSDDELDARTHTTQRFSDTFVAKVQSQQQYFAGGCAAAEAWRTVAGGGDSMTKCCGTCRRPRPQVDIYCACEDPPGRRILPGCSRPPPTRYYTCQRKRNRGWWCCKKKDSECWNHCHYCHQKIKRPLCPPYMQKFQPDKTFLQRFKQYLKTRCPSETDIDMYNAYVDTCNMRAGVPLVAPEQGPSCNWCPKQFSPSRRNTYDELPMRRTRSYSRPPCHGSEEQLRAHSEDEYIDEPDSDSDDCCCCCPCRKCYNTTNCQTEQKVVAEPKTIDTQTERRKQRRCCRCCRNACVHCHNNPGAKKYIQSCTCPKRSERQDHRHCKHASVNRQESTQNSPNSSPANSPRAKQQCKRKTIICKAAGVQIEPSFSAAPSFVSPSNQLFASCPCSKKNMQNMMFGTVNPTPLFLDKMFQPICTKPCYNLSNNPLDIKLTNQFLSPSCNKDADGVGPTVSSMTIKTKKRFMNAVCDSILGELSSKRQASMAHVVNSPDSGFQEAKLKSSLFSAKKPPSKGKYTLENMIKTLKGDRKKPDDQPQANVMGEASKVVRSILEEITSTHKESQENMMRSSGTTLRSVSLRNILLSVTNNCNVEHSRSDSILLETEIPPGGPTETTPEGGAGVGAPRYDESYTKLMHALDTIRNKNRQPPKVK